MVVRVGSVAGSSLARKQASRGTTVASGSTIQQGRLPVPHGEGSGLDSLQIAFAVADPEMDARDVAGVVLVERESAVGKGQVELRFRDRLEGEGPRPEGEGNGQVIPFSREGGLGRVRFPIRIQEILPDVAVQHFVGQCDRSSADRRRWGAGRSGSSRSQMLR